MEFELWGLHSSLFFGFPIRFSGFFLFGLDLIAIIFLFLFSRKAGRRFSSQRTRLTQFLLLIVLIFSALVPQIFIIRLQSGSYAETGDLTRVPELMFSILGAVPWMLAGGLFGIREAVLAGFLSGIVRGGWGTASILTPMNMAVQAGIAAVLIRQDYREWPGQMLRHPFIAGTAAAAAYTVLRCIEIFSQTSGEFFDVLNTVISYSPVVLVAAGFEAGIAGLACELISTRFPKWWYSPKIWKTAPYNRSLAWQMITGFLLMGIAAGGSLLYGDWLMADRYAQEITADQMELTAAQIGDSVPYFVQTGRSLIRQYAEELGMDSEDGGIQNDLLSRQLRLVPYFSQLAVLNEQGEQIAVSGSRLSDSAEWEIERGVSAAFAGMPQEITIPPESSSDKPVMVFLAPVPNHENAAQYVLAGWTDLSTNPMLLPAVARLESLERLQAYVVDENSRVLLQPDISDHSLFSEMSSVETETVILHRGSDGIRRLLYAHDVDGYPWRVIITVPKSSVDQLAIQITVRLAGVMSIVGVLVVGLVYLVSQQLTRPIRQMAHVAVRITEGDLDHPVKASGDDEIGRLSESFETMRTGLQSRLAEMNLLLNVSQKMATSFDLSSVLPAILQELQDVVRADQIRFVLAPDHDRPDGVLECYQSFGLQTDWHQVDREILHLSMESGFFLLENPSRAKTVLSLHHLGTPLNSIAAIPLRDEGHFIGVLWLGYQVPHAFSANEINLLTILAAHLGVSISNARLYHRAEQERSRLVAILEASPDAVIVIDDQGGILLANPAAEDLFQSKILDVQGTRAEEVITSPDLIDLLLYSGKETHSSEVHLNDGKVMHAVVSEIIDRGAPAGKVCVLSDITHFKRLESMKTEFVSTVSHDLKAPMNLMKGYVTMLSMVGDLNDQQEEYLSRIRLSLDGMTGLVDNLLDLRRIEAGEGVKPEKVQITDLINSVVQSYRPQAVNRQLTLHVEVKDDMDPLMADPVLLRQAFANLLENSIKYTQPKGVVVIQAGETERGHWVRFRDSGVGISAADRARLFDRFRSLDERDGIQSRGMGLGLAIVKSIVDQHGGTITVESKLGEGSVFTVEIPFLDQRHNQPDPNP